MEKGKETLRLCLQNKKKTSPNKVLISMQKVLMFQCVRKSIPALTAHTPFTSQVKIRKQDDYYNNN